MSLIRTDRPLIWAHRGASGYAPENTLAAFKKAIEMGADGIELDVQLTKDNKIVVIHDETINRTSNGCGWVKDLTFEELRKYNYNKTHPEYEYADIPLLEEVYELIKSTNLTINVEIKTGIVFYQDIEKKVLELTSRMGLEDRVIYSSFNHKTCVNIKNMKPDSKVGFLYADGTIGICEYAAKYKMDAIHPALYNLQYPDLMPSAMANGLMVNSWTINEPEHIKMALALNINAIITNYPDVALGIVNS